MARLFALLLLLCASSPTLADGRADAERCRREVFGDRLEFSGRIAGSIEDAITYCTRAIESGGLASIALADALHDRGLVYATGGRYAEAVEDFDAAIKLDAKHARAYFARGTAHARSGQLEQAIGDFDRAIELDPAYTLAYSSRGNCYRDLGRYDLAIADYDEAIRRNSADSFAYESRGRLAYLLGRFAPAASDLAAAVQRARADHYPVLWLYLARLRAGGKGIAELRRNATRLDLDQWPGPVVRMYLGDSTPTEVADAANDSSAGTYKGQWCELNFYFAELLIVREPNREDEIKQFLRKAEAACPHDFMEYAGAVAELRRLGE